MRPRLLAIDWSGAEDARSGIAVAVLEQNSSTPMLIDPKGNFWRPRAQRWTRKNVLNFLEGEVKRNEPVIVGIDCNFALPFSDGEYMDRITAETAKELWQEIDHECDGLGDLFGRQFTKKKLCENSRKGFWPGKTKKPEGFDLYCFRETEKIAASLPGMPAPKSPLQLDVDGAVALGGLAGMRMLNHCQDMKSVSIWPFDKRDDAPRLTVVEIYPALFKRAPGMIIKNIEDLKIVLGRDYSYSTGDIPDSLNGHQIDALASVAGMAHMIESKGKKVDIWNPPEESVVSDRILETEGWIFGVPWPEKGC